MRPLEGFRIVEFCQVLAGPFCGCLLADMGAEVIKVEPPGGDPMRQWPPMVDGESLYFASLNRNKRSIVLDLKQPADLARARELALSADAVIENFRPGVMARFGLDHATLARQKPSLVMCSISAFGQTGPRSGEGAFDMTMQAISGLMSVTGERGGEPVKCGVPIADFSTGLYGAFSVSAALHKTRRGEAGEHIDMSMLGAMLGISHLQTTELFATGHDPVALGSSHPTNAPYAAFACRDGHFAIAAGTDKLWKATCEAIDRPALASDPRFSSNPLRAEHRDRLDAVLAPEFARFDRDELLARLRERGVPCAPINRYSQALADPQTRHMRWVETITLPNGAAAQTVVSPQWLSGERLGVYRQPPALGAHTDEVLAELDARGDGKPR